MKTKDAGITLIALIITIIVLLILAGVSLNVLVGDNGIISNAQNASVKTRFAKYNEELGMNALDDTGIYASKNGLKDYIKSMEDQDLDKFVIIKSKLVYIGSDELESQAAESLGLGGGSSQSAVTEIQSIVDGIIELGDINEVPSSDSVETENVTNTADGLIGTRLYERNSSNILNGKWNIVDEYNSQNEKTARYESGYYLLEKGKTYTINGEAIKFENNYVVDYKNKEFTLLSDRAINWNKDSILAVGDPVLNLDPSVFADGKWVNNLTNKTYEEELTLASTDSELAIVNNTFYNFYTKSIEIENGESKEAWNDTEIQKTGDVVYVSHGNYLEFNENNDGGYLQLSKNADFTNGFTFEIYLNLSRLAYDNGDTRSVVKGKKKSGFFWRGTLGGSVTETLRFFDENQEDGAIGKFYGKATKTYEGDVLKSDEAGLISFISDKHSYGINEDFYETCVYIPYYSEKPDEYQKKYYDEYMINNGMDRFEYYINGKLIGKCYYDHDSYQNGLKQWNKPECPFRLGCCPVSYVDCFYYLKGKVYSTRLYEQPMTSEEVKDNYDMTLKYHSSF